MIIHLHEIIWKIYVMWKHWDCKNNEICQYICQSQIVIRARNKTLKLWILLFGFDSVFSQTHFPIQIQIDNGNLNSLGKDENYILGCSNKMFNDFHSSIIIIWIVILWVSTLYIFLFPKPFLFNSRMDIQVDIFPQLFLSWHKKAMSRFNDHTLVWRVLCCAL